MLNPGLISPTGPPAPNPGPTNIIPTSAPTQVTLTGAGYKLQFTLPALTVGSAATVTAQLQATPPPGVPALQSRARTPQAGTTPVGLVYLTLSTTAGIGFASLPSFVWTLPSASVIPSGSFAYMSFYDPGVGWNTTHTVTAAPSGTTLSFPGAAGGFQLAANAQYVYALTTNTIVPSTPSPAPVPSTTPSPAPAPTATPPVMPAYCGPFKSYAGASVPLNITDDSGLNGTLVAYVETGNGYLTASGSGYSSSAVPLPVVCYPTTTAGVYTLNIPNPSGGRILFAYAQGTPGPSSTVPNPLPSGNGTPVDGGTNLPWDKIEYALPGGIIDTTQVDALGLPIEMSLSASPLPHQAPQPTCTVPPAPSQQPVPAVVGFSSCGELNAFNDLANNGAGLYKQLLLAVPFNGSSNAYVTRIYPEKWDLSNQALYSGSPVYSPPPCTSPNTSYMCGVLASYRTNPQLFTSNVSGAGGAPGSGQGSVSGDWYCASSDGSSAFIFTDVGQTKPTSCATPPPLVTPTPAPSPQAGATMNPFRMPVSLLESAQFQSYTTNAGSCQFNNLFNQPYGLVQVDNQPASTQPPSWYQPTGNLFENNDAFALWKALVADIGYGQAMQPGIGVHPGGQNPPPTPPVYSSLWTDPFYSYYDQVMHHYADGGFAYGTPYDDLYKWESGYSIPLGASINVRINPLPSVPSSYIPNSPASTPTTCPTVPIEVGSW